MFIYGQGNWALFDLFGAANLTLSQRIVVSQFRKGHLNNHAQTSSLWTYDMDGLDICI